MLKAVLFDVDGTLAETEEFHRRAFNQAFAEQGLAIEWSRELYRELLRVTGGKERLRHYFLSQSAPGAPLPDEALIAALHARKNAIYKRNLVSGDAGLRPGVLRLIAEARENDIRLGIATTTSAINLDALLGPLLGVDWTCHFAVVVAGDAVARKKPAPDVYESCLQQLGVAPEEAIAIEDSTPGVASAKAAGVRVLLTPSSYTEGDDFSAADAVVPDLGDPMRPWQQAVAGFAQRWIDLDDLRALVVRH
jgi:HAD superfamily hydrolase (TIGR01509 family)